MAELAPTNCSVIVVPSNGAPKPISGADLAAVQTELLTLLETVKDGFCYVHVNGQLCRLSKPIQVFKLKLPDGKEVALGADQPAAYPEDYAFRTLVPFARPDR